jgi:PAS domain S-box-containing protein
MAASVNRLFPVPDSSRQPPSLDWRAPLPPRAPVVPKTEEDKIKILIVDDRADKLLAIETILAPLGQNLVMARSGREALKLILQHEFTVIILDVNMPDMDGFETAGLIRQRKSCAHTPILFVTSFSTGDTEVYRGYSLGAVDYLFTPVVPDVLRSKVSVFVELTRKSREVQRQAETLRKIEEERLQRKLAETHTLLEDEARRNRFFRLSIELLAIADYEGRFTQTNPTWHLGLGYPVDELNAQRLTDFVHPEDAAATEAVLARVTLSERPEYFESRFRHHTGVYRWLGWTIAPFDEEGLLYIFARDITERREREEEIRKLNEDLGRQAHSLQALNQELETFSYSISHDLRAPLRAISSYSQMLIDDNVQLTGDSSQMLQAINRNSLHMSQLIDDFLNFFRVGQQEVTVTAIDTDAAVKDAIIGLRNEVNKRTIDFQISPLPPARGDRVMVGQIFVNLIANAVKFTQLAKQPRIEISCQPGSSPPIYCVKDNGAGFNMEHYSKLFGVFQRLHNRSNFPGTGIGLAIVQKIVQRHGGRIWAESKVNEGAAFYFTLAAKDAAPPS